MSIRVGDRVIATEGIGGFIGAAVPKGTKGVVTQVSGLFIASYAVDFENGRTETVGEKLIAKLN